MSADAPLQLRYLFTSSPNPIRASAGGANAGSVELQVMVSPSADLVTVASIEIDIPVGDEAPTSLTAADALPQPTYDQRADWTISTSGEVVTIVPAPGASGLLTRAILFTLPGIVPNGAVGSVGIAITESTSAGDGYDDQRYSLDKLPAEFPVSDFWAEPNVLSDPASSVVLKWKCTDQGAAYGYSVHSDLWRQGDCEKRGECLTCADGAAGIRTPTVPAPTTFSLDVVDASSGHRQILDTLQASVQVIQPDFAPSRYRTEYLSGQLVRLGWVALNASRCSVLVDDESVDEGAPTESYRNGYPLLLPPGGGTHSLSVIAHAAIGSATAPVDFPEVVGHPSVLVGTGNQPWATAFTTDGAYALVATSVLKIIDVKTTAVAASIGVGSTPATIAVTGDGRYALVGCTSSHDIWVVDLQARTAVAPPIAVGNSVYSVAVTPDGKTALSVSIDNDLTISDVATRTVTARVTVGNGAGAVAVTPDGKLALVANNHDSTVSVVDLGTNTVEPDPIPVGSSPWGIAVTPDGALALVTSEFDDALTVIDVAARRVEPSRIRTGVSSRPVAISRDGAIALLANFDSDDVTLIDVPNRRALTRIHTGGSPVAVAISPNGMRAAVANSQDSTVRLL